MKITDIRERPICIRKKKGENMEETKTHDDVINLKLKKENLKLKTFQKNQTQEIKLLMIS